MKSGSKIILTLFALLNHKLINYCKKYGGHAFKLNGFPRNLLGSIIRLEKNIKSITLIRQTMKLLYGKNDENTVEPQWLKHLWDHRKLFETWVVRATES